MLRIGLCQINTTVGDIEGNTKKILGYMAKGKKMGADLLVFPEMAVTGYPPEDLLFMPKFIEANLKAIHKIARATSSITALVGFVDKNGDIFNAAALLHHGKLVDTYCKSFLPNYGVFDEDRYFQSGKENLIFTLQSTPVGPSICEDLWYPGDPIRTQALFGGAELIVNISSSPYHAGKVQFREKMISTRAQDNVAIVAYCNLVGGQDELVFDGGSLIFDQTGNLVARGKQFEEDLVLADLDMEAVFRMRLHDPRIRREKQIEEEKALKRIDLPNQIPSRKKPALLKRDSKPLDRLAEIYAALVLGTGDYIRKNGFQKVVIGLSGGIDSALTAAIAVDALGKQGVVGVAMPSPYSSKESIEDAKMLARNLDIQFLTIPIHEVFQSYLRTLSKTFNGLKSDETEENIQARIRGTILMALSNKFGWLVLNTGNKSEMSVGYCTLYGDMAGGYAVLKDVPKTLVYELTKFRNRKEGKDHLIPKRVCAKPPSAELRPSQKDEDSLPPYSVLDPILKAYVEEDKGLAEIAKMGLKEGMVKEVINMVDHNEYKRRQSPPGVKITHRALGKDRRLPITNKYRNY